MKKRVGPGPRGLSKDSITEQAIELREEVGASAFTLRKLGGRIGCDPMSIVYHFHSKDGLYHAIADKLESRISSAPESLSWKGQLRHLAEQYRDLALQFPKTFWIMQHFFQTGLSDFGHMEMVYGALKKAGVPEPDIPALCLGWYACITGLAMAEVGGLVRPPTEEDIAEVAQLPDDYRLLKQFLPYYQKLAPSSVFSTSIDVFLDGIASHAWSSRI